MDDPSQTNAALRRSLAATAWICAGLSLVAVVGLLISHGRAPARDPWKSAQLLELKARLAAEPRSDQTKMRIREDDFSFRRSFRRRLAMDRFGAILLAGGALASVIFGRAVMAVNRAPVLPLAKKVSHQDATRNSGRARWAVSGVAAIVMLALSAFSFVAGVGAPTSDAHKPVLGPVSAAQTLPSLAELQVNWPRFRGWDGSGVTSGTDFPVSWNEQTGEGIVWKTPVLAPGHNSPVVWNDRVFITGGTAARREVFCYSAETGQLEWRRVIEHPPGGAPTPDIPDMTGWAASTPATDGRRLYVIFANGDSAALDFSGTLIWAKSLGPIKNMYGHAGSLAMWRSQLIVQLDQGLGGGSDSSLLAIDGLTGSVLWKQERPVGASWATPVVFDSAGQSQVVAVGEPWVVCYGLPGGVERWRAKLLESEIVPSPVVAGGRIFAVSPSSKLFALKIAGAGDVTSSGVVWSSEENVPDIASPVSDGELVFTLTSGGMVTCFDALGGAKLWEHDLGFSAQASPSIFGQKLLILGQDGAGFICSASREYRPVSSCQLNDNFLASPAFARGSVFARGETNLYCLGSAHGTLRKERADAKR